MYPRSELQLTPVRREAGTSATTGKSSSPSPFHMVMLAVKIAVMIALMIAVTIAVTIAVMTAFAVVVVTEAVPSRTRYLLDIF